VDYKTGVIAEPDLITSGQGIRSDYQIQMKLYAALYNSMFGKWPASIELIGLDGVSHPIFFQPEECLELLDDALELLSEVNSMISTESRSIVLRRLASPSPVACRFCLYRPCCPSYWQKRSEQEGDWPHDTRGKLKEIKKLGNGLILIKLISSSKEQAKIAVRGLHPNRHPALINASTDISVFSMIPDRITGNYREGYLTTIYIGV